MSAAAIELLALSSASPGPVWVSAARTRPASDWSLAGTSTSAATIVLRARALPEGVWLVTSDQVPGLIVEAGARLEALALAREMVWDLAELDDLPYRRGSTQVIWVE